MYHKRITRSASCAAGFALAQMELTLIIARLAQRLDIAALSNELPRPVGMRAPNRERIAISRTSERPTV